MMHCDRCDRKLAQGEVKILTHGDDLDSTALLLCGDCYEQLKGTVATIHGVKAVLK